MNEKEEYAASSRVQWNETGYEYSADNGATWKPFSQGDVASSLPAYGKSETIHEINAGAVVNSWHDGHRILIRAKATA